MKRKNGFTLIELIAVMVIVTIIGLILVQVVTNIINKIKIKASYRNVDNYGKVVETSIATYLLDHGSYSSSIDDLEIEYTGNKVKCDVKNIYNNGAVYLTKCKVNNKYVLDNNGDNSYYYYGKRYGVYKIGDTVTYKGIDFYVIEDSEEDKDYVKLLKAEPLDYDFVNSHAVGIITPSKIYKSNNYASIPYYYREEGCNDNDNSLCDSNYLNSDIKKIVNMWQSEYLDIFDLIDDDNDTAYARLIKKEEYENINYSNFEWKINCGNIKCGYWFMTKYDEKKVYFLFANGGLILTIDSYNSIYAGWYHGRIRLVIALNKSALN